MSIENDPTLSPIDADAMSPVASELTPAEQLGLPQSVTVMRSSGDLEPGWVVDDFKENYTHPDTGELITAVKLSKRDEEKGKIYTRAFSLAELQEWNPPQHDEDTTTQYDVVSPDTQDDDDTLGMAQISGIQPQEALETAHSSEEKTPPTEEVAQPIGEASLLGAKVEVEADDRIAQPKAVDPQVYERDPRRVEQAMTELRDYWGLPEDATTEDAVRKIDAETERIEGVLSTLHRFDGVRNAAVRQISTSLSEGKMGLNGSVRSAIEEFAFDTQFNQLIQMVQGKQAGFLPTKLQKKLEGMSRTLVGLQNGFTEMNRRGPDFVNVEGAQMVQQSLVHLPETTQLLSHARSQLEEMRNRLAGYRDRTVEKADETIKYRNEHVQGWATELEGEVAPERLEEIMRDMEAEVLRESGEVDNPHSPSRWFGGRIMKNDSKDRARVDLTGRSSKETTSHRYVTENMVDMLTGKFRVDLIPRTDEIMLDKTSVGGVDRGQHRVAALAMLYGEDWQKTAKKLGFKIENSR